MRWDNRNAESPQASGHERRRELMQGMRLARRPQQPAPMAILLGFVPFIAFALLSNVSVDLALWVAFAAAFAIAIRDFAHSRLLRLLDVGSVLLFGLFSLYVGFLQPGIPIQMARLVVDGSLFAMAIVSVVMRSPLTRQYAQEHIPQEFWDARWFVATNYLITIAWAIAFALMAAADAVANMHKNLPITFDIAVSLIVLAVAILFTARYPHYLRAHVKRVARKR